MKPDLVLGVIKDMKWADIRPYVVSLACSGYEGHGVMYVENIDDEGRAKLKQRGFDVIDFESPLTEKNCNSWVDTAAWTDFGRWRYTLAKEYLDRNIGRFRNVIWTDVRDLMFQLNPSDWLVDNLSTRHRIIGAGECWKIGDQPHNAQWVKFTSPTDYPWLAEEEVICAGTVAGDAEMMAYFFEAMCRVSEAVEDRRANDQGIFNYLMRKSPFKEIFYTPRMNEGWTATAWGHKQYLEAAYSTDGAPVFNSEDYVVYTPNRVTPFSIVHQYDREINWRSGIEQIMEAAESAPPTPQQHVSK